MQNGWMNWALGGCAHEDAVAVAIRQHLVPV